MRGDDGVGDKYEETQWYMYKIAWWKPSFSKFVNLEKLIKEKYMEKRSCLIENIAWEIK